jgi:putative transcriptional regulator
VIVKAEEIKKLRESFRMTQEDFAHELGVTFATVNRWENRKAVPSRLAVKELDRLRDKSHRPSASR